LNRIRALILQIHLLKALWREKFQIKDVEEPSGLESLENLLDSLSPPILRNIAQKAGIESISLEKSENQTTLPMAEHPDGIFPRLQAYWGNVNKHRRIECPET
jgi:hypothetical protein